VPGTPRVASLERQAKAQPVQAVPRENSVWQGKKYLGRGCLGERRPWLYLHWWEIRGGLTWEERSQENQDSNSAPRDGA
jgi:hypothetical protein